ncbi:MAG: hypothetical protein LLG20_06205 [Acidobacteriales bacterium]|nr:hypothetical protein [Terriglobales bacterium]
MNLSPGNPLLRLPSLLLAMLSLSIGWGIRGNFGHEFGAMMPGMLCAVAVALFSERQDWRERVPFFAFFGAIGWAFGGSMSYMPAISYTHSGHLPTQIYGIFAVFAIGFLWASLGGAGTAYAAIEDRERMTALFRPVICVFAVWALDYFFMDDVARWYVTQRQAAGFDAVWGRQRNPFYWLDSDWLAVLEALFALCLFDLWERRFEKIHLLAGFGALGALAGGLVHNGLAAAGWLAPMLSLIVHPQGDLTAIDRVTGKPFDPALLMSNWPQVFYDLSNHMGWILGLATGIALYFVRYGKFRSGASLPLHMAVGGLLTFLAGPVLLSNMFQGIGGFRMVPPRGDNWAIVLGVLLGLARYMRRNNLKPVVDVALLSGLIGGVGFQIAQTLKILLYMPGNPALTSDPATVQAWAHWHSANWHSIMAEQGVGLFYGLAIVLPMSMLARRIPVRVSEPRVRRWTEAVAVFFILNVLLYVNLVKNVSDWTAERTGGFRSVTLMMKAPLMSFWQMSALAWFNLIFALIAACTVTLLLAHMRRPLAVIPGDWLGKGQLFYLLFLWAIVIGNFEKALVSFHEQRLATEGTIFVNALVVTVLILLCARPASPPVMANEDCRRPRMRRWIWGLAAASLVCAAVYLTVTRVVYGDTPDGFGGRNRRFGAEADWRVKPILRDRAHR